MSYTFATNVLIYCHNFTKKKIRIPHIMVVYPRLEFFPQNYNKKIVKNPKAFAENIISLTNVNIHKKINFGQIYFASICTILPTHLLHKTIMQKK